MNILFIAPIPPPIDGQSKASKVLLDKLIADNHNVFVINLTKIGYKSYFNTLKRVFDIFYILFKIFRRRNNNDIIYLSLAESFLGNIRDLFIYSICYKNIDKVFIHMLGGAGMKKILERNGSLQLLNKFFFSRIGGVLVEGPANFNTFSKVIDKNKITIVPNFAEDFLFTKDHEIEKKFTDTTTVKILYLSNLLPGKGYNELADAYIELSSELKDEIEITFVGSFQNKKFKSDFLKKISNYNNLIYLGDFIDGEKKRQLFCNSHVFCLPTYYPFEGQPISILEAYATGCFVVTTNHSEIPFIFSDGKNGYIVEKKSVQSIKEAFEKILKNRNKLLSIAINNRNLALDKYRTTVFQNTISEVFNKNLRFKL